MPSCRAPVHDSRYRRRNKIGHRGLPNTILVAITANIPRARDDRSVAWDVQVLHVPLRVFGGKCGHRLQPTSVRTSTLSAGAEQLSSRTRGHAHVT